MPLIDTEAETLVTEVYRRADAFLFGRRTYETFAGSWGAIPEMRTSPIGAALNSRPKYVVSTRLTDPQWAGVS
jgi:dihydrofolate reductase